MHATASSAAAATTCIIDFASQQNIISTVEVCNWSLNILYLYSQGLLAEHGATAVDKRGVASERASELLSVGSQLKVSGGAPLLRSLSPLQAVPH